MGYLISRTIHRQTTNPGANVNFKMGYLFRLYSDWVCTAVMSNDVMKDLRG